MVVRVVTLLAMMHLGLLFVAAGMAKVVSVRSFRDTLVGHHLLPMRTCGVAAHAVPLTEVGVGTLLVSGVAPRLLGGVAASFLFGFLIYQGLLVWAQTRTRGEGGRTRPCGCLGEEGPQLTGSAQTVAIVINLAIAVVLVIVAPLRLLYSPAQTVIAASLLVGLVLRILLVRQRRDMRTRREYVWARPRVATRAAVARGVSFSRIRGPEPR